MYKMFSCIVSGNVEISEMSLYEVSRPRYLFLLSFRMGMVLASLHMCGMMLILRASVYSCVRK